MRGKLFMKKILVADLIGTLIPDYYNRANYLYGDGTFSGEYNALEESSNVIDKNWDKAFAHTSKFLSEFIRSGNEVHVVTSIDSHMTPKEMSEKLIRKLYLNLLDDYKGLNIYFQTHNLEEAIESLNPCSKFVSPDGTVKCVTPDGLEMLLLEEKSAVFEYIPLNGNSIYTIGDTYNDLGMLRMSLSLGGRADFINYNLYFNDEELKRTLSEVHYREEMILLEKIALERYPEFYQLDNNAKAKILEEIKTLIMPPGYDYRKDLLALYDKAFAGKVDINRERIINLVFEIIDIYNKISRLSSKNQKQVPLSTCYDIGMYPTFQDYYTRVLKK